MKILTIKAQGDVLLIKRAAEAAGQQLAEAGPETPIVLAEGETTGHRHALYGGALMFRDDAMARGVPADLYIGTVKIAGAAAELRHEEHGTITLDEGTWEARGQREYHAGEARRVAD